MNPTSQYLSVCADTWIQCQQLLHAITQKDLTYSFRTTQVLDECAAICFGTMEAVRNSWQEVSQIALLCVGLCEECAEVCERYSDSQFQQCASFCKQCSAVISTLAAEAA